MIIKHKNSTSNCSVLCMLCMFGEKNIKGQVKSFFMLELSSHAFK